MARQRAARRELREDHGHAAAHGLGVVASAVGATQSRYGTAPVRGYQADLIVPRTVRNQCALLKGMALRYVMRTRAAEEWYEQQRTILLEVVDALLRTPEALDPVFHPLYETADSDTAALRSGPW